MSIFHCQSGIVQGHRSVANRKDKRQLAKKNDPRCSFIYGIEVMVLISSIIQRHINENMNSKVGKNQ